MKTHISNGRPRKFTLTELRLIFVVYCVSFKIGLAESMIQAATTERLLEHADSQLGRMSTFRGMSVPQQRVIKMRPKSDSYQQIRAELSTTKDVLEIQKHFNGPTASASELLHGLKYQATMQDRIKRSFISGIANKLLSGIAGVAGSGSRGIAGLSSSNPQNEYGSYGPSYQAKFDVGDFAKAIINTLIQAIKAIGGGAIAGGGALVKGGGNIVSAKGQIISSAGNAISSLGKAIAGSAIIASQKPVHGHVGYPYNYQSSQEPNHDLTYDGPPPSEDAYTNPQGAYDTGHYTAPSNGNVTEWEKENSQDEANKVTASEALANKASASKEPANKTHEIVSIGETNLEREEIQKRSDILEALINDPTEVEETSTPVNADLYRKWNQRMANGLSEESRKEVLKKYSKKGEFYTEAPQITLEIAHALTEIAKKRDKHFEDTQKCVGSALISLGSALTLMIEPPEEGIEEEIFLKLLCDTGKLLTDVFHQQPVARKSFITPLLNKSVKPTLEATISDKWLYGKKFNNQVKDAKAVEKANIKEKPVQKFSTQKTQENSRYPLAASRQVGTQRRSTFRFKRNFQAYNTTKPSTTSSKTTKKK